MVRAIDTNHKIKLKYTVQYSAAHSFYWSIFCSSLSFSSLFLLSKHFSNSQIGIVLALANIFSVLLQPAVAAFADTTGKISLQGLTLILTGTAGAFATARGFLSGGVAVLAVVFILELTVLFTMQPLLNAMGMQLINRGIGINFGFSRGMGSLTYAVCSVLLGILAGNAGPDFLPWVSVGLYLALGAVIFTFTKKQPTGAAPVQPEWVGARTDGKQPGSDKLFAFLVHNRRFTALMVAVALVFCSHSMINNYMIQIAKHVGGTAKEMGIATGIAAAIELPAMTLFTFLVRRIRCSSILKFSLLFFVIKTAITMAASSVWMLYAAQIFQFCSYALFIPASIYYVNEIIRKENLAKGQAFMTSAITFGGVIAGLLGGWLLDFSGVSGMLLAGLITAALGFLLGFYATEKVEVKGRA